MKLYPPYKRFSAIGLVQCDPLYLRNYEDMENL